MYQPLLGVLEHVGLVLLGFFLVLGIFVAFVGATYTFVQPGLRCVYEVTGWTHQLGRNLASVGIPVADCENTAPCASQISRTLNQGFSSTEASCSDR